MDGFTIVDGGVLALIALSAILAWSRGLVRETLSILGWVIAAIAAFYLSPSVEPLIREAPVVGEVIGTNCELGLLAAFAAVFAVALVVVSIFTPLLSGFVQNSALGPVDQGLGLLFGVARGVLLVVIVLVVYDRVLGGEGGFAQLDNSRSAALFAGLKDALGEALPEDAPQWVERQYAELTKGCQQ